LSLINYQQVIKNHQKVCVEEYTGENIMMPSPEEAPYLDLQVENYHRPTFGTFHSKFMTVDRKYAVISSNNIQVIHHPSLALSSLTSVGQRQHGNDDPS
jgi:hypothetical protein